MKAWQRASAGLAGGLAGLVGGLALFSAAAGARARTLVPADGEFMEVDGYRLHYVDRGKGPAIVMVHGLGGQLRNFSYALTALLTDRYRVVLVDRPGSGWSSASPGKTPTLAGQAALIAKLIARLGLERPLLVGHSLGGAVSLALALDHPRQVGALALIAPLTAPQDEVPAAFRSLFIASRALRLAMAYTIAVPGMMALSARRRDLVFAPEPMPEDFEVRGGGLLLRSAGVIAAASADIADVNDELAALGARYADLAMPVAMLFARGDRVLDYRRNGEAMAARVPGLALTLCDGGHMLPVTQPAMVADWLDVSMAQMERDG